MKTEQQDNSPYVEEKVTTWKTMSRTGRVAVSAGILAVGAFTVAGPAMPVMAQIVGLVSPQHKPQGNPEGPFGAGAGAGDGNNAAANGNAFGANLTGDPFSGGQPVIVDGQIPGQSGQDGRHPNIQPVPASIAGQGSVAIGSGQQKLQLPPVSANFGNTGSATPSAGGGNTGYSGGKAGKGGEREHGDDHDVDDDDREGDDD